MSANLPAQLDPWQAVAREVTYAGSLALRDLPRLREALVAGALDPAAAVVFELAFRRDEARRPVLVGRGRAVLPLECQRCLGVVEYQVDAELNLMLMQGKDLDLDPPEPYEPLPVIDDRVSPAEVIEDELLLALPQIPMHPVGGCRGPVAEVPASEVAPDEASDAAPTERPSPFAVLAGWKPDPDNRT